MTSSATAPKAATLVATLGLAAACWVLSAERMNGRETDRSGVEFGVECIGSSIGLMVMLVAVGVMSIGWMAVIAVLVVAQKLLPARAAVDIRVAAAIIGLGILILVAPSAVPGLMPSM